jgi:tetratricopeptide (TPR) repeat protein
MSDRVAIRSVAVLAFITFVSPLLLAGGAPAQTTEADVYVGQAVIDFDGKRYDEAVQNLRRALELEPDHIEALYYMGVVYMARRQPGEAASFLLKARERAPNDPAVAFQLGLAYFAQQRYDQAEPLLEQVFGAQPTLDGLGYYVGFMRYRKKDYRGALDAFQTGRVTDADLQQLTRFYTSLTLAALGRPTQAAAEVEQALRLAPGSPLTGPAERLRDTIVAPRGRERCPISGGFSVGCFSAELKTGLSFDDNVAVVPNPDSAEPLTAQLRSHNHESIGEILGLRADYAWLKPLLGRADWDSTIGYSFFATKNNDLGHFNVTDHMFNTALTHRLDVPNPFSTLFTKRGGPTTLALPGQVGGQYAWDVLFLGQRKFLTRNTATVFGAVVEPIGVSQIFGRYQNKDFNRVPGTDRHEIRDGENLMVGAVHLVPFGNGANFVKVGYQWDHDFTIGSNYEYSGNRLLGGAQYTLGGLGDLPLGGVKKVFEQRAVRNVRLKFDVDVHLRQYDHVNTILPSPAPATKRRRDDEITTTFRGEYPLLSTCGPRSLSGEPRLESRPPEPGADCVFWTLVGEYQHTTATSNIQVFDYTRNVFSLLLSLTY